MAAEEKADEWELLPPNTSFLPFGLEDIKDLYSKEIDYIDYFIEQPPQQLNLIDSEEDKSSQQSTVYDAKSVPEIKVEDPKQNELKDEEDLADKQRSKGRRPPLVAGIAEMLPIGAAVVAAMLCGFLLGSGRRQRSDTMRFHMFKDDKEVKQMVRQANRINQVLVASARGMPPPVMQPATISFGGCFGDMI